jgi:hypothetical protein
MTTAELDDAPVHEKSLASRIFGVLTAPRATYASVAAFPKPFGVLAFVILVGGATTFAFLSSDVGRAALLDEQAARLRAMNRPISEEQLAQMQRFAPVAGYVFAASQVVVVPAMAAVLAGVGLAIFSMLGGQATFMQSFAVVSHSFVLNVLQVLFTIPLNLMRQSLSGSTSLAVFAPMLADTGFAAHWLGAIDLFRIWWLISLAIGFGVLYRRKTAPIAMSFLGLYLAVAAAIAGVMTVMSGA